jgi:hypothetical protein
MVFSGCGGGSNELQDKIDFSEDFMLTFETERISGIASRGIAPLLRDARSTSSTRATVPASDASPLDFSITSGVFPNYPLPGLTTSYTVATAPDVGANVYLITSTTAYPVGHVINTYVEKYYIQDFGGDGTWNYDDPVVDETGTIDPTARVSMTINYNDGSTRHEKIVKIIYESDIEEDGFAAFDIQGSLNYPDFAYPASDPTARFSSVVVYTHEWQRDHDYWFWSGSQAAKLLGVRYYTEHEVSGGDQIQGTTVSYERAVSLFSTEWVDPTLALDDVFVGTELDTLAESVFRQRVVFDNTGSVPQAVLQDSVMKSHVVNATDYQDFILTKLNEDEVALSDWENAPYYIPSGISADEIAAENYEQNEFLVKTVMENPDGPDMAILGTGPGDLAALYTSITTGAWSTTAISTANDIPGTIDGVGVVNEFNGDEGLEIATSADIEMSNAAGTVLAWVYIENHTDTAGIVHKGELLDFSDEAYSLQFMGNKGNVAFAIVEQSPSYRYSMAKSNIRLNTGKWYFLAGTWDADDVNLYIFGEGVSYKGENYYLVSSKNNIGAPLDPGGPLIIGSQFVEEDRKAGYYGLDGLINGVVVDNAVARSAAVLEAYYNEHKAKTAAWN